MHFLQGIWQAPPPAALSSNPLADLSNHLVRLVTLLSPAGAAMLTAFMSASQSLPNCVPRLFLAIWPSWQAKRSAQPASCLIALTIMIPDSKRSRASFMVVMPVMPPPASPARLPL